MPIAKYFKGKGETVMAGMMKKHGEKAGKREFYATANKMGMTPMSHLPKGASQSPKGDLGILREKEGLAAGGFRDGAALKSSGRFTTRHTGA